MPEKTVIDAGTDEGAGLAARKKAWRRAARELFALISREERAGLDAALCARLWDCARERVRGTDAKLILGYAAMADEADVTPFLRRWASGGGRVALPVWVNERDMVLREVTDFDAQTAAGRGGILEPLADCAEVGAEEIDLVIAPGRFFSERCERLGRGAGCYDALLSRSARSGLRVLGAAYDFQIVPVLPAGAEDRPVDAVMTPTRTVKSLLSNSICAAFPPCRRCASPVFLDNVDTLPSKTGLARHQQDEKSTQSEFNNRL